MRTGRDLEKTAALPNLDDLRDETKSITVHGSRTRTGTDIQGGAGGLAVGWVDLDLECSTILLGQ